MCTNETGARLQPLAPTAMLSYPFGALKQLNEAAAVAAAVNTGTSAVLPPPQSQLVTSAGPLVPSSPTNATAVATATTLDHYRLQFYNYAVAERLRYTQQAFFANPYNPPNPSSLSAVPHPLHLGRAQDFTHLFLPYAGKIDPRFYLRPQEEPKPQYSYIGLIAMAILSSPDKKLVLSDIYQYILDNYSYFRTRGPGWRNSIRHNLSLNDCFIKAGRSANGKGHYWAIHPANIDDFTKGDFRRRKAQRKVRKSMGLSVDEEDSPTPPSSPVTPHPGLSWPGPHQLPHRHPGDMNILPGMASHHHHANKPMNPHETSLPLLMLASSAAAAVAAAGMPTMTSLSPSSHSDPENPRKRLFDMASLLAPDDRSITPNSPARADSSLASTSGHRGDSVPEEDDEGVLPTPSPNKRRKIEEEEVDVVSDDFSHVPGHDKEADHNSEDDTWSKGLETATPTTAFTTDAKAQEMPLLQADQILATDARDAFQALLMERQQRLSSLNGSATPSNWRANTPCSTPYPLFPNPSFQMARPLAGVNLSRYASGTSVLPPSTVNNPQAIFASPIEQLNKYYEQLAETVRLNFLNQKEK